MKRISILVTLALVVKVSSAQFSYTGAGSNIYYNQGYVSLGFSDNATEQLQINGNLKFGMNTGGTGAIEWFTSPYGNGFGHKIYNVDMQNGRTDLRIAGRVDSGLWGDIITFLGNGQVAIGTIQPGSFKLAVEGKIGAREVHVTLANPWPDYVFCKNYKLRSLNDLDEFIKANNHLPDMPAASQVEKEGVDLGEMNAKLLQKIEELTLYVIELKKENEQIKEQLKNLSKQ